MRVLRIDDRSPYRQLIGVGGVGTGIFFDLEGNRTLGRNESRLGRLLDVRDYCKLHIVIHYVAKFLGAHPSGSPFHILPVGRVGADDAGCKVIEEMKAVGIDTIRVLTTPDRRTLFSVCFQYPDGTGGNITTSNSAAGTLCEADLEGVSESLKLAGRRGIALAVPEVPLELRFHFLQSATQAGAFRAASFAQAEVAAAKQLGLFNHLDLVALNEEEAAEFLGLPFSPENPREFVSKCQEHLRSQLPHLSMIISAGRGGAYGLTSDTFQHCPAPEVDVASSAGAGDSLLGGVLAALAAGLPLVKSDSLVADRSIQSALQMGVWLASYKCLSPHTIHPSADLETLSNFVADRCYSFSPQVRELIAGQAES